MTTEHALVSIITPCYNAEKYIETAIASVQNQSYAHWEMLIIDDCSTDNSATIVKKHAALDPRIRYYKTETGSGSPAVPRNIGLDNANGRYIAFLDSDDYWFPEKLTQQIPLFSDANTAIVYGNYEKIDEAGNRNQRILIAKNTHTHASLLFKDEIGCCTAVVDREKVGEWLIFKNVGLEDYELWLRILREGFIARNCGDVVSAYRVRAHSVSSNKIKAAGWIWNLYRNHEQMGIFKTLYYFVINIAKCSIRYVK